MVFQKGEFYLFVLAGLTVVLIYNVAAKNLIGAGSGAITSLFGRAMGLNSAGNFQKPF